MRRRFATFVLSLALIAPWGASAAVTGPEPGSEPAASLWGWLTALWAENGCRIDPDGCPTGSGDNPSASSDIDNGCRADPNGTPCTEGQ